MSIFTDYANLMDSYEWILPYVAGAFLILLILTWAINQLGGDTHGKKDVQEVQGKTD